MARKAKTLVEVFEKERLAEIRKHLDRKPLYAEGLCGRKRIFQARIRDGKIWLISANCEMALDSVTRLDDGSDERTF